MDTYQGDGEDPITLHKYLYAGANPVNQIDQSGHDGEGGLAGEIGALPAETTLDVAPAINGVRALQSVRAAVTITAALGAQVLSDPSEMEEVVGQGQTGIAFVQNSFLQMETVLTQGEAEATSLAQNGQAARTVLNQLYTGAASPNPAGIEYHHIVEQGGANASTFGSALQSFGNIVPMSESNHLMITSFYKTGGFRDWMAMQDWNTQWSIGLTIVKQVLQNGTISYTR
jgi:hypothetical protein